MLKTLGIVVLVIAILLAAIVITRIVLFIKYGWPAKLPFYIVEFVTADKKSNYFTIAYSINNEVYRLKLRQFPTYDEAKSNVESIIAATNRYTTKKKLIAASNSIPAERLLFIEDLKLIPTWVIKFMNFTSICLSKTVK